MDTPSRGHMRGIRGGNGRFERSADTAARDAQATGLRSRGYSYQAIADALGMHDRSAARKAVERALLATIAEPCEELRRLELMRLDTMAVSAWAVLDTPHPVVSDGKIMVHVGAVLTDPRPVLHAIDRLLKISERRSRLLALDAPIRVGVPTIADADAMIAALEAELGLQPGERPSAT